MLRIRELVSYFFSMEAAYIDSAVHSLSTLFVFALGVSFIGFMNKSAGTSIEISH